MVLFGKCKWPQESQEHFYSGWIQLFRDSESVVCKLFTDVKRMEIKKEVVLFSQVLCALITFMPIDN